MGTIDDIRRFWDEDAPTYDDAPGHRPRSAMVDAAWTAALDALLPSPPARVLDCGAGTGFLTLIAASMGHRVTALDLSPGMLERLSARVAAAGADVAPVLGTAAAPPDGPFDAVMERHLLWTLPDPLAALHAWHDVAAPGATLVLVESLWGEADPVERGRASVRRALHRLRRADPEHHAEYSPALRGSLPLGAGTHPSRLVELVTEAGWTTPRLHRLADVEWAERTELGLPERLTGVPPRFAVVARR